MPKMRAGVREFTRARLSLGAIEDWRAAQQYLQSEAAPGQDTAVSIFALGPKDTRAQSASKLYISRSGVYGNT